MNSHNKKKLLSIAYIAVVFFSIHYFSIYYILANFLNQYFNKTTLSILFAMGAMLSIVLSHFFGRQLKRKTNEKSLSTILIIQFLITFSLSLTNILNIYFIAILAVIQFSLFTLIWTSINIFISEFSVQENIGTIRGTILTIYNFGAISAPFLMSQIFNLFGYPSLFIISSLALIPLFYINKSFFRQVKEPVYKHFGLRNSLRIVFKDKDIRGVILSSFFLNSFFTVMNVYLVLYLTEIVGIPIVLYLELILPISLIPFILVPYNLGKYSDEIFGEKKAMLFGIFLMSSILISIYIFNIKTTNIFIWMLLIFLARVGATTTETENYAYFYKKIDSRNAGLIALFQNMTNISFIFVTLFGALLIGIFNINLPVILSLIGIIGLLTGLTIYHLSSDRKKSVKINTTETSNKKIEKINSNKFLEKEENKKIKIWA